jgi:hypothetical protein
MRPSATQLASIGMPMGKVASMGMQMGMQKGKVGPHSQHVGMRIGIATGKHWACVSSASFDCAPNKEVAPCRSKKTARER